jgi:hypothetical protein
VDTRLLVPDELCAEADGRQLNHPRFSGDDLTLGTVVEARQPDVDLALPSEERATRPHRARRHLEDTA